ncbi:deSI-like protein isoform X1, partial [Tanacetum coccineum]
CSGADVYTALAGALCGPLNGEANEVGCRVYGMEYWFGAHDYSISGVFKVEPRSCPGTISRCLLLESLDSGVITIIEEIGFVITLFFLNADT